MAEVTENQTIEKIRQYANESKRLQEQEMDVDPPDEAALEARLDYTLRELQDRLRNQQEQLEKV